MTDNLIGDRYLLGPLLGRGGMADVRRARDTRLERDVAIKRLKPDLAGDPVFQERFRREAHAAAGLNHPNIVSVFDTGESFDEASGLMIPYIVMELVVGHTLRELLLDGRKIQPAKALELTQCVLEALDYSHRHGIVHRDIKPANVMLTNNGQVKVMDFGIARAVSDTQASMTQTASVIGTPQYLSPEQIRGETVDRRSDLYSTGCLLYELLVGKPPFEGDSPVSLAYQHVRSTPVPPSEIDPLISAQMDAVCLKALAKGPADRYQNAQEMNADIARLLSGQRVQAQIPPPVQESATEVLPAGNKTQVMEGSGKPGARALLAEEEEPPSHLGRTIGIIVGVALVIALIAVALIWNLNNDKPSTDPTTPSPTLISVPQVITMTEDRATETLESKDLRVRVISTHGPDDDSVGKVVAQDPQGGSMVAPFSYVVITINVGPKTFPIPDLKGQECSAAEAILRESFNDVVILNAETEGPNDKAGHVVSTEPAGGNAPATKTILIYCATGQVKLPIVVGMTRDQAMKALTDLGIPLDRITVHEQESSTVAPQTVLNMEPGGLTIVAKDTPIQLWVAVAPKETPTDEPSGTPTGG